MRLIVARISAMVGALVLTHHFYFAFVLRDLPEFWPITAAVAAFLGGVWYAASAEEPEPGSTEDLDMIFRSSWYFGVAGVLAGVVSTHIIFG